MSRAGLAKISDIEKLPEGEEKNKEIKILQRYQQVVLEYYKIVELQIAEVNLPDNSNKQKAITLKYTLLKKDLLLKNLMPNDIYTYNVMNALSDLELSIKELETFYEGHQESFKIMANELESKIKIIELRKGELQSLDFEGVLKYPG